MSDWERKELHKMYSSLGYQHAILPSTKAYTESYIIDLPTRLSLRIRRKFYKTAKQRLAKEQALFELASGVDYPFIITYENRRSLFYAPREKIKDFYLTRF